MANNYAETAAVQAFLNQLGGSTLTLGGATIPTSTQVGTWLDQVAAEVDVVLKARGYGTVPATGTTDKAFIGRFVAQKGACMAYNAGFMYDNLPEKVQQWCTEYDTFLERLLDGTYQLVDQTPGGKMGVLLTKRYVED